VDRPCQAWFCCEQVAVCMELAVSEYWPTCQCLTVLRVLARLGRMKFVTVLEILRCTIKKLAHISLAYDHCPLTYHPQ